MFDNFSLSSLFLYQQQTRNYSSLSTHLNLFLLLFSFEKTCVFCSALPLPFLKITSLNRLLSKALFMKLLSLLLSLSLSSLLHGTPLVGNESPPSSRSERPNIGATSTPKTPNPTVEEVMKKLLVQLQSRSPTPQQTHGWLQTLESGKLNTDDPKVMSTFPVAMSQQQIDHFCSWITPAPKDSDAIQLAGYFRVPYQNVYSFAVKTQFQGPHTPNHWLNHHREPFPMEGGNPTVLPVFTGDAKSMKHFKHMYTWNPYLWNYVQRNPDQKLDDMLVGKGDSGYQYVSISGKKPERTIFLESEFRQWLKKQNFMTAGGEELTFSDGDMLKLSNDANVAKGYITRAQNPRRRLK